MDATQAKERIEQLREQLNYYSARYYNDDNPEISDFEYDRLMRELEGLEDAYPQYIVADSPTRRVGGVADKLFSPVTHIVPMESLRDAFSFEELVDFDQKIRERIAQPVYSVEPKIDGLSVSLEY
ncbi:MAG: NAD-dependent DNA ligase LigA, partial [Clostridia bacterium]|nr:NAD-dependent DNA ligase LigA [Clostridia bacterium]